MRYAIIDNYSGFVWGVADADSPAEVCRIIDEDTGTHGREYVDGFDFDQGYLVHRAPEGFEVSDGQDEKQIQAVANLPEVARIGWKEPEA